MEKSLKGWELRVSDHLGKFEDRHKHAVWAYVVAIVLVIICIVFWAYLIGRDSLIEEPKGFYDQLRSFVNFLRTLGQ